MSVRTAETFPLPRFLRRLSTGLAFFSFMSRGLILGVILFPLIRLMVRDPQKRRQIYVEKVHGRWSDFTNLLQFLQVFRSIDVVGLEKLKGVKNPLIIANHVTLIDVVVLGGAIPDFNCVVKASLWQHRYFGAVVRACKFIPNMGGEEFVDRCRESYDEGRPLILFPQGTRTLPEEEIQFQRGAAQVAARLDVTVVPVQVVSTPPTLMKGKPWWYAPKEIPRLTLTIGDPLEIPKEIASIESMPKKVRRLNAFFETQYQKG